MIGTKCFSDPKPEKETSVIMPSFQGCLLWVKSAICVNKAKKKSKFQQHHPYYHVLFENSQTINRLLKLNSVKKSKINE